MEGLSLEAVVARLGDAGLADAQGRTLASLAAATVEEGLALQVLAPLLDRTAALDVADSFGLRPMDCAARQGHVEVVRALLARSVAVEARERSGRQPLHHAALHGHVAVARVLLEGGASVSVKDGEGREPWQLAAIADKELVHLLVSPGVGPWYG